MKEPVLCLCNYGQVRSVTMAQEVNKRGYKAIAAGMINTVPHVLDALMEKCETIIVCNKPNVERKFDKDAGEEHAKLILACLEKHKAKIVTCDTIGFDRWGKPGVPDLVERCNNYLDSL